MECGGEAPSALSKIGVSGVCRQPEQTAWVHLCKLCQFGQVADRSPACFALSGLSHASIKLQVFTLESIQFLCQIS